MQKLLVSTALLATATLLTACGGKDNKANQATSTVISPNSRIALPNVPKQMTNGNFKKIIGDKDIEQLKSERAISYTELDSYDVRIGDKSFKGGNDINLGSFKLGWNDTTVSSLAKVTAANGDKYSVETTGRAYLYNQNFSLVGHIVPTKVTAKDAAGNTIYTQDKKDYFVFIKGKPTVKLPISGTATYFGTAFIKEGGKALMGNLEYKVDFEEGVGSGNITASYGNIGLYQAPITTVQHKIDLGDTAISSVGISGNANSDVLGGGKYSLAFFGEKAEEIAGNATFGTRQVGFGGQIDPVMYGTTNISTGSTGSGDSQ